MKYIVTKTFRGSQTGSITETFEEGAVVELSDDLAAIALKEKWVKPVDQVQVNVSIDRIIQLVEAIDQLEEGNEEHWTSDGRPDVAAMKNIMDGKVSAAERDAAWKAMQADKGAE